MKKITLAILLVFALSLGAMAEEKKHAPHKGHKAGDKAPAAQNHAPHKGHKAGDCKTADKGKNCPQDKKAAKK